MKPRKFEIRILDNLGQLMYAEEKYGWDERDVLEKTMKELNYTSFTTIKIYLTN